MGGLRKHFQLHGSVHAWWAIAVLILIIAALLLFMPNGTAVNEYISFASSLSSLLLAVVAMFYAFISNQNSSENVSDLRASALQITNSSGALSNISKDLYQQISVLTSDFSDIRPRVEQIHSQISGITNPATPSADGIDAQYDQSSLFKRGPGIGVRIAFYELDKAFRLGVNRIDLETIYGKSAVWLNFMQGVHDTIYTLRPCGIELKKIERDSKDEKEEPTYYYEIVNVPVEISQQIQKETTEDKFVSTPGPVQSINAYLASQI